MANPTETFDFSQNALDAPSTITTRTKIFAQRGCLIPIKQGIRVHCEIVCASEDALVVRFGNREIVVPSGQNGQAPVIDAVPGLHIQYSHPFIRLDPVAVDGGRRPAFMPLSPVPLDIKERERFEGLVDASGIRIQHTVQSSQKGAGGENPGVATVRRNPTLVASNQAPALPETYFDEGDHFDIEYDSSRGRVPLLILDADGGVLWTGTLDGDNLDLGNRERSLKGDHRFIENKDGRQVAVLTSDGLRPPKTGYAVRINVLGGAGRLQIGREEHVRDEYLRFMPEISAELLSKTTSLPRPGTGFRYPMPTQGPDARDRVIRLFPLAGVEEAQEDTEMLRIAIAEGIARVVDPTKPNKPSVRVKPGGEALENPFSWVAVGVEGAEVSLFVISKPEMPVRFSDNWAAGGEAYRQSTSLGEAKKQLTASGRRATPELGSLSTVRGIVPATAQAVEESRVPKVESTQKVGGLPDILGNREVWAERLPSIFGPFGYFPLVKPKD